MVARQGTPVTIIGAGFSGLSLAYFLTRAGVPVRVLEKAEQAGGLLGSKPTRYGPIERAAMTTANTAAFEELCLGSGTPLLHIDKKRAAKRFVFRGKPRQWPLTAPETLGMLGKVGTAAARKTFPPVPGETLKVWGERVLGRAPTRFILEPFFGGVFAGDSRRLSAGLLIGGHLKPRTTPKPPKPKMRGVVAPAGGMGDLTARLHRFLESQGVSFAFGADATLPDTLDHPHVVCSGLASLPAVLGETRAAALVPGAGTEMVPVVSLSLIFPPEEGEALPSFGCLFPRDDQVVTLGALFMSHLFPPRHPNWHVETWMLGGAGCPDICSRSDEELLAAARRDRVRLMGRDTPFVDYTIQRWTHALPHYTLDLEKLLPRLPTEPNLFFHGNWLGVMGLGKLATRARLLADELTARAG